MTTPDPFGYIANRQRLLNETAKRNDQRRRRTARINDEYDRAAQIHHDRHARVIRDQLAVGNTEGAERTAGRYLTQTLALANERATALERAQ